MMKRILLVAKKYEGVLLSVVSGAGSMAGRELYSAVKDRLKARGVPVEDRQMRVSDVPPDKAYWHE
jgi:hypothetical protein